MRHVKLDRIRACARPGLYYVLPDEPVFAWRCTEGLHEAVTIGCLTLTRT